MTSSAWRLSLMNRSGKLKSTMRLSWKASGGMRAHSGHIYSHRSNCLSASPGLKDDANKTRGLSLLWFVFWPQHLSIICRLTCSYLLFSTDPMQILHSSPSSSFRYFEQRLRATEESYREEVALLQLKLVESALEESVLKTADDR